MLRVLHVSPWYEPSDELGGVPVAATNMCKGLVNQGLEVHVFTTISMEEHQQLGLPLDQEVILDGVRVHYFLPEKKYWLLPAYSRPMNQRLKERIPSFDLVHIHATRHWHGMTASSICSRHKIPFIVSPHAFIASWMINGFGPTLLKNIHFKLLDRLILSRSAAIHYCSKHERCASKARAGNTPSFVVTSGVAVPDSDEDIDNSHRQRWRKKFNLSDSDSVLLFVGRIHSVKNLHLIIEALAQLQDISIKLFCVGLVHDNKYFEALQKQIKESNLEESVIFIPPVKNKKLYNWYLCADVFVLPSIGEGASLSLSEALSYGLPVILSDGVSNGDDIQRAKCGRVVPQDVGSFVKVFRNFVNNSSEFEEYSRNARSYAQEHFDQNKASIYMLRAYYNILTGERHEELDWVETHTP